MVERKARTRPTSSAHDDNNNQLLLWPPLCLHSLFSQQRRKIRHSQLTCLHYALASFGCAVGDNGSAASGSLLLPEGTHAQLHDVKCGAVVDVHNAVREFFQRAVQAEGVWDVVAFLRDGGIATAISMCPIEVNIDSKVSTELMSHWVEVNGTSLGRWGTFWASVISLDLPLAGCRRDRDVLLQAVRVQIVATDGVQV